MFKILKQEFLFIPFMLLLMEAFRAAIFKFYPETALFDRGSELESFLLSVWQIVWITSASWLLIRIVFPPAFKSLKKFYESFDKFSDEYKQGFSLKLFACFFFGLVLLLSGKAQTNEAQIRTRLTDTLNSQLHVRELTGNNDGVDVEKYLAFVGFKKGFAWCAAFASYNLFAVGITSPPAPRTAWAPVYASTKYVVWSQALKKTHKAQTPKPGDCFTLFYPSVNRVGHVGFIVGQTDNYFITIEGNTGLSGSREGSGVHKLKRSKDKVYAVSNYITPYIQSHEKTAFNTSPRIPFAGLQSQANKIGREDQRNKRALADAKGFNLVQRQLNQSERLDYTDQSYIESGFMWQCKYAGDSNGNGTFQSHRFNPRWRTERKVRMQRPRTKSSIAAAFNSTTSIPKGTQATNRRRQRYKGSSLYPEMG